MRCTSVYYVVCYRLTDEHLAQTGFLLRKHLLSGHYCGRCITQPKEERCKKVRYWHLIVCSQFYEV
jgi:hypothetical protein